jgi:hypothetical protein
MRTKGSVDYNSIKYAFQLSIIIKSNKISL